MLKTLIVMLLAITAGAVGDIFLTQGMRSSGDLSTMGLRQIFETVLKALTNWRLILGTAMQALSYVVVAFLAQWYLGENVTPMRWAGISLVCVGVMMITKSSVN